MKRQCLLGVSASCFAVVLSISVLGAAAMASEVEVTADVVYGHKYGMALTFDVLKPADANGAAVLRMESGGWRSRWRPTEESIDRYQALLDHGFTVFTVRHGSSPKFVIPEIVPDVRRAVRFVRVHASDFGIDPDRIGVWGEAPVGTSLWCWAQPPMPEIRPRKIRYYGKGTASRRSWPTIRRST